MYFWNCRYRKVIKVDCGYDKETNIMSSYEFKDDQSHGVCRPYNNSIGVKLNIY